MLVAMNPKIQTYTLITPLFWTQESQKENPDKIELFIIVCFLFALILYSLRFALTLLQGYSKACFFTNVNIVIHSSLPKCG